MAYNNNIPQPTDVISNSQGDLLANFAAIDSGTTGTGIGFSRNHVTMTDATNGGLHNRIDFFQNIVSPSISGFVSSLYPKASASNLFYKNGTAEYQLTSALVSGTTSGTAGPTTDYTITLPFGLILKFGSGNFASSGSTIGFSTAFPTAFLGVVLTTRHVGSPQDATYSNQSASGFTGYCQSGTQFISWMAWGN